MSSLEYVAIVCPYCGEHIDIEIDCSAGDQAYVEDCSVCCRPIDVEVAMGEGGVPSVSARHENE